MHRQFFSLGRLGGTNTGLAPIGNNIQWDVSLSLDSAFWPSINSRIVQQIVLSNMAPRGTSPPLSSDPLTQIAIHVGRTARQPTSRSGQHLKDAWENNPRALTFYAGYSSVVIPGPNHPSNQIRDDAEIYTWTPSEIVCEYLRYFATLVVYANQAVGVEFFYDESSDYYGKTFSFPTASQFGGSSFAIEPPQANRPLIDVPQLLENAGDTRRFAQLRLVPQSRDFVALTLDIVENVGDALSTRQDLSTNFENLGEIVLVLTSSSDTVIVGMWMRDTADPYTFTVTGFLESPLRYFLNEVVAQNNVYATTLTLRVPRNVSAIARPGRLTYTHADPGSVSVIAAVKTTVGVEGEVVSDAGSFGASLSVVKNQVEVEGHIETESRHVEEVLFISLSGLSISLGVITLSSFVPTTKVIKDKALHWPSWLVPLYGSFSSSERSPRRSRGVQVGPSIDRTMSTAYTRTQNWTCILRGRKFYDEFRAFFANTRQGARATLGKDPLTGVQSLMRITSLRKFNLIREDLWQVSFSVEVLDAPLPVDSTSALQSGPSAPAVKWPDWLQPLQASFTEGLSQEKISYSISNAPAKYRERSSVVSTSENWVVQVGDARLIELIRFWRNTRMGTVLAEGRSIYTGDEINMRITSFGRIRRASPTLWRLTLGVEILPKYLEA